MKLTKLAELDVTRAADGGDPTIHHLAFADDGRWLAATSTCPDFSTELVLVDPSSWQVVRRLPVPGLGDLAFAPDIDVVEIARSDVRAGTGEVTSVPSRPQRHGGGRLRIQPPDGNLLVIPALGVSIDAGGEIDRVSMAPDDGSVVVSIEGQSAMARRRLPGGEVICTFDVAPSWEDLCFTRDGEHVIVVYGAYERRGITVAHAETGAVLWEDAADAPTPYATAVACDPATGRIAIARATDTDAYAAPDRAWIELFDVALER